MLALPLRRTFSLRALGMAEIILSGIAFGVIGVFGKTAYRAGFSPGELLSLRFLFAAPFLWAFVLLFRRDTIRFSARTVLACAGLGILGYAVFSFCYFEALQSLSASLTVLLLYLYPVLVTLASWLVFRERLHPVQWLALPVVIVGMLLLVGSDFSVSRAIGFLFGVGSAVFYAAYILASDRLLRGVSPLFSVALIQSFAGVALGLIHLHHPIRIAHLLAVSWPSVLAIAVISTALAMTLFLSGLQKVSSAEVSILSMAEPLTGVLAATWLLGERLSAPQIVGGVAILAAMTGIALTTRTEVRLSANE